MEYLHWDEKTITDFSPEHISELYNRGYVFTRKGKGVMHLTRSVRIDLKKFELSSENRRILKRISNIELVFENIPYAEYYWPVAKLAKDFYSVKFGGGKRTIMGAAKMKETLTDANKSNFNSLFVYTQKDAKTRTVERLGYTVCYRTADMLHYCYPFYDVNKSPKDMGLGMMTKAIIMAKEKGLNYVYLGSLQRPSDTYKLQFIGMEWFDGGLEGSGVWRTDTEAAKKILRDLQE